MARLLSLALAATMVASAANAQSFGGSSWSVGEDAVSEKASGEHRTMFEMMLQLVGFDQQLEQPSWIDVSTTTAYDAEAQPAEECETHPASEITESANETESAVASSPEPMFFIF
ncbi:MAG: hypothetical protein AAGJ87_08050 [Pseudomonadota bacterium]